MNSFAFKKEEKLCSQKIIGELFTSGNTFLCFPLKVIWINAEFQNLSPVQAAFSVPKRNFKKSHDRNFIKRRIREAYRMHKNLLYQLVKSRDKKLALMIVYVGKEKFQVKDINAAVHKIISKFEKELN